MRLFRSKQHHPIESPYKRPKRRRSCLRALLSTFTFYLIFRPICYYLLSSPTLFPRCRHFDHGDTASSSPDVASIFNCNSPSGRCKWYHPAKFFDPVCGVGSEYAYLLEEAEAMRLNRTLWPQMPPIILEWVSLHAGSPRLGKRQQRRGKMPWKMVQQREQSRRNDSSRLEVADSPERHIFPQHNISMVHVHKTGGTSLVFAMGRIHQELNYEGEMHVVYPQAGPKGIAPERYAPRRNATGRFLDGAVKYKNHWGSDEHTLFAVVRDPVERFISSIGQAAGGQGSNAATRFAHDLSQTCLTGHDTPRAMLTCFVGLVKTYGTWIEVHFTPMVLEISFSTMYKDIPVAVFPFREIPTLLQEFDADSKLKRKDGAVAGHRKNDMLTKMNLDDYDEATLKDLCEIYRVDVLFLWHMGYATRCDDLVSFG